MANWLVARTLSTIRPLVLIAEMGAALGVLLIESGLISAVRLGRTRGWRRPSVLGSGFAQ